MSHPIQEEDRIASAKIIVVAIVSLAVFGVGVVWAVSIERNENQNIGIHQPETGPAAVRAPEVGIVYQWPFFLSHYAADKGEAKKAMLESYGWVDKDAKVVHIPIDQAMERYVSQAGGAK
ncbi:MAG: hypothetical protein JWN44_1026 [Myxococcales bacterium]|nr:hypothetical protein [Myxococcales bacterium]